MIYRRTSQFKQAFRKVPEHVQQRLVRLLELLEENPQHPALKLNKVAQRENLWQGQIDDAYRFTLEYQIDAKSGKQICLFRIVGKDEDKL